MNMRFRCRCFQTHTVELSPKKNSHSCHICGKEFLLHASTSIQEKNILDVCPLCEQAQFWVQRDFHPTVGMLIVAAGCVLAFVVGLRFNFLAMLAVLVLLAALDWALYVCLPNVTKCYVCKSEFRSYCSNPEHEPFNLARADAMDAQYRDHAEALRQ